MSRDIDLPAGWEFTKVFVMFTSLCEEYSKEPYKTQLLNTGEQYIQEGNTWGDIFWGVDLSTNVGYNTLGYLIMFIRKALREDHEFE